MDKNLKVSIITVVWNNKDTIKDAIESVLAQTYKDIEYIVVDGASSDGTLEVIKRYEKKIDKFISEKDSGIYDAMNKGLALSSGDIVGVLNSDDFFASDDIIQTVVDEFRSKDIDCLYADLEYVDAQDTSKVVRYWKSKEFDPSLFKKGWHPAHPTFYVKKEFYDKYGFFDLEFKIASDYEIMLRFLQKYQLRPSYVNKTFVKMRIGGASNGSIRNIFKANMESYRSWKKNDLYINPFMFLLKPLSKILQLFKVKS
jgi:glycosyltransferase